MPSVVLFQSVSQYQSLNTMAREIADAWEARGVAARMVNLRRSGYEAIEAAVAGGDVRAVITISGYGIVDPHPGGRLHGIYRNAGVPVVSLYFDPLFYYLDQLDAAVPGRLVTTTSDAEIGYWRSRPAPPADIRSLPHGAAPVPAPARDWRARDIPLLFSGSGPRDPEGMRLEWADHGRTVAGQLNRILEVHRAAAAPRPLDHIIAEAIGGEVDVSNPALLQPYFLTVDLYLRARLRWRLISALADRPLTVVGDGWEALAERLAGRRVRFLPAVDAAGVRELIGRSRITLNTCTPHHGSHERVFQAMAAGSLALTTPTGWFDREAPAGALVRLDPERDAAGPLVDDLLAAPERAETLAETGRRWFLGHHTWSHRVDTLEGWLAPRGADGPTAGQNLMNTI